MQGPAAMFQRQYIHLFSLIILLAGIDYLYRTIGGGQGSYLGMSTSLWLVLALAIPILHQAFVALAWRAELYHHSLSRRWGDQAFHLFTVIFFILFVSRLLFVIPLAIANRDTLPVAVEVLYTVSFILALPVAYTFYSVLKYFSLKRALGIDHFDAAYRNAPLVRRGMFRYFRNSMYVFGIAILWLPGLLLASKAALLAALFNHLYIWVHYYTVELPDMRRIYGDGV
jgi:protein-S-isoprenylcysteine O-methyltransferase Ste14